MTSRPQISVLTPTYNCADYLPRTYHALCAQTVTAWEWVVVNDGSTDATESIINSFADERIRYIKLPQNKGRGHARAVGLAACKAPYTAVWDADDIYMPKRFATALAALEATPEADYFCSHTGILDAQLNLNAVRGWLADDLAARYFVHHTLVVCTPTMQRIGYPQHLRVGEDLTLVLTLTHQHQGIFHADILAFYLENREIHVRKALAANVAQLRQILNLYHHGVLTHTPLAFSKLAGKMMAKIIILIGMCAYPPLYLKTISRRQNQPAPADNTAVNAFLTSVRQAYPPQSAQKP